MVNFRKNVIFVLIYLVCISIALVIIFNPSNKNIWYDPYATRPPFLFDPKLMHHRFIPFIKDYEWDSHFTINSHGFRGEDFDFKKQKNEFRIIVIGDSCVFGACVDDQDTYCYKLEKLLNKDKEDGHIIFRVINAGLPGMSSFRGLMFFKYYVNKYKPDILLVQFGWNDHWKEYLSDRMEYYRTYAINYMPEILARIYLTKENKLKKKIILNTKKIYYRVPQNEFMYNIESIIRLAKKNNTKRVILITAPSEPRLCRKDLEYYYSYHLVTKVHKQYISLLKRVAKKEAVDILDLAEIIDTKQPELSSTYFSDPVHFNKMGHTLEASELYNYLNSHNMLPQ